MSDTTRHGENIANEIQCEDAYGHFDNLTVADVWSIIDNLHSHFCDQNDAHINGANEMLRALEGFMRKLEEMDEDLPL